MKQTVKRDRHSEFVEQRARKSATYRKSFARTLQQVDLALLVREMREDAGLTQTELARKVGTAQSVIARLEDAEYTGHSLTMLERIAAVCGVALKLHAEKSRVVDARAGSCDLLGFTLARKRSPKAARVSTVVKPARKSEPQVRDEGRGVTSRRSHSMPQQEVLERVNRYVRGWVNYFHVHNSPRVCTRQRFFLGS